MAQIERADFLKIKKTLPSWVEMCIMVYRKRKTAEIEARRWKQKQKEN
jgi:hypothetical protein